MAKGRNKSVKKRLVFLIYVLVFFLFVFMFFSYNVNPIIKKVSQEKVKELTSIALNDAAAATVFEIGSDLENILQITKNDNNDIEALRINTLLLNVMARKIVTKSQNSISNLGEQGIGIPIGTLSGMPFFAGRGKDIKIKVFPVGSVSAFFNSEFISAGINQTKHRIEMTVNSSVSVIMPGLNKTVKTVTTLIIAENIIIGKVPEVYLQSNSLDEMLNLIP